MGGTFTNILRDFGDNDTLVLPGFAFPGTETYTVRNGTLTVTGGTNGTRTQNFRLDNDAEAPEAPYRWTRGEALLPASLWEGCAEPITLQLELGGERLLRWRAPDERMSGVAMAERRRA